MTVLLVVGVGVVALGALVLLLFPDRPGGKIGWQGAEVSSLGAGLPLIVVGIVAIGMSGGGVIGGGGGAGGDAATNQTTAALKCPGDLGKSLPPERVANVEVGAHDQIVVGAAASKTQPFGLRFTDAGATVGAITARFFPASSVFKIQSLVDADCHAGAVVGLVPGEGRLEAFANWEDVRIDFPGRSYVLRIGSNSDIRLDFTKFVP